MKSSAIRLPGADELGVWGGGVLSLASDVLSVVSARSPEAQDRHGVEPLAVLKQLVEGPHALGDDHVALVEPGYLK